MANGQAVEIKNKTYQIGTIAVIAGKKYEVYNTMPGLKLIGFAKLSKRGQRTNENITLSFDQISRFVELGAIA